MIPSVVARQIRETVLDYLRTTFALSDRRFEVALFDFLDGEEGLFRGPYIDVRLPFRRADSGRPIPLDIAPPFLPWRHQAIAFERLTTRDGHAPEPTLVTTGTGSGKTECFLYPVLDHCWRQRGRPGIKAILLYPMNALAADQARRLAQMLWDDPRLRGTVRAGLFVGGEGSHGVASREHLVDDRKVLRESPPDILLTNYRMLDFLLMRPEDQALWRQNEPDTLRYLVLDELHTYDGAQGSDVACLLRRLQARLGARRGSVCPVGTSATIAGGPADAGGNHLVRFASRLFGVEFGQDSLITEDRCGMVEVLGAEVDEAPLPRPGAWLDPREAADATAWLQLQRRHWLPALGEGDVAPGVVAEALRRHSFLRQVLRALDGKLRSLHELDAWLVRREPGWRDIAATDRARLLDSFLALVSHARIERTVEGTTRREPFLTVQVQLWMRELRHLLGEIGPEPRFAWAASGRPAVPGPARLPLACCRSCGAWGWAALQRTAEESLQPDLGDIHAAWLHQETSCRFVALRAPAREGETALQLHRLDLSLRAATGADGAQPDHVAVHVAADLSERTPQRFLRRCPTCDADQEEGLSILGSRAPSLLSVAISHIFQSDYNQDRKLLAFTDSVQVASHRSGFFAARTYRFNLRTAMQGVLEGSAEDLPMLGFADRLFAWLSARPGSNPAKAVATLWPQDLVDAGQYQAFRASGEIGDGLLDVLRSRLSWEVAMEYGHSARVGRTLERANCSTVAFDEARVAKAVTAIRLEIADGALLDAPIQVAEADVRHWALGLLHRLRIQGGASHPLLDAYQENGGNWFFLTKSRNPILSPFGSHSRLPRFLVDVPPDGRTIFPSVSTAPDRWTWHRDWTVRALGCDRKERGVGRLLRASLERLVEAGLLTRRTMKGGGNVYGLAGEALRLSRRVGAVRCAACGFLEPMHADEVAHRVGRSCVQYRCGGRLVDAGVPEPSYYGRRYRSGNVERIFAHEHTGLLAREERERIEDEFKAPTTPDAPNLFVCTPTLEMGVDIGDLSATVLCSVPPTTANHLQRVGRAGRKTGNALCLTMAEDRPHDLYFLADPMRMMRGQVEPPGCFLDAPEMLRRQYVAYAMDCWARQETELRSIPPRTSLVLGDEGAARFPGRFLAWHDANATRVVDAFFAIFGAEISAPNRDRLRMFAAPGSVAAVVREAFDRVRAERAEFQAILRRTRERLQAIEDAGSSDKDAKAERDELESALRMLRRLLDELGLKYPLNALTDAGVLPNYAFPEPGVTLKATIRAATDEGGDGARTTQDYMRAASSAIRELAPWNTFYADGRKHVIQELDLGPKANRLVAPWRLCAACSHMERTLEGSAPVGACPRCGDGRWSDAGQVRQLLRFERVRSLQTALESAVGDDGEDRQEAWYEVEDLIDVGPENRNGARVVAELPFGLELLKDVPLREVNFGNRAERRQGAGLDVAGRPVGVEGFRTCLDCGRVREPGRGAIAHAPWCSARRIGAQEDLGDVLLYREVRSEAIRLLLPVVEYDQERQVQSFKAALELGFRKRFQGAPRHLQLRLQDEPAGGEGRRRFLVLFDTVPGGTGYLSELWHGDNFRTVLELAHDALEQCECQQQEPAAAGCYRCLYAYQSQRHLAVLSNREARAMLAKILASWQALQPVETLSGVSVASKLESELEAMFLAALGEHAQRRGLPWIESIRNGTRMWQLTIGGRTWEIHAQRLLGEEDGVAIGSQPDFVITPKTDDVRVLPVAVFLDGREYHVRPGNEKGGIADDCRKRAAIQASGNWIAWSATWRDVVEFRDGAAQGPDASLLADIPAAKLGKAQLTPKSGLPADCFRDRCLTALLRYLEQPDAGAWRTAVDLATLAWLTEGERLRSGDAAMLEQRLREEPARFVAGAQPPATAKETVVARLREHNTLAALGRCSTNGFQAALRGDGSGAVMTLRLFDDAASRAAPDFESAWRRFLHSWNLLQFLPGCSAVTSEMLAEDGMPTGKLAVAAPAVPMAAESDPASPLYGLAPQAAGIVRQAMAHGAGIPVVGYEHGSLAEAECAWPDRRIAILRPGRDADRAALMAEGWRVIAWDEDPTPLLQAIRQDDKEPK